jgi:heptosyltransferase-2
MAQTPEIKKILYITLSNLGDAMMALPAFDFLRRECPQSQITVVVGPRTRCVFENHPDVGELIVFDKHAPLKDKIRLFLRLKRAKFDCIIDLKNTFYRWGLRAAYKNPAWIKYPHWCQHSSQKHLYKAIVALRGHAIDEEHFEELNTRRNPSFILNQDFETVSNLLAGYGILEGQEFALIVPGALSSLKRWAKDGFIEVGREIIRKYGLKVVVAGIAEERGLVDTVVAGIGEGAIGLCGRTTFGQLAAVVLSAKLVICNDSGVLHTASYLDKLVIGIYGPSDYKEYGPWSKRGLAVRKNVICAPCGKAHCVRNRECIETITPFDVMLGVRLILEGDEARLKESRYRRILVARTDRIGDVLLSTPVLKALREHYPMSYIAMMVAPATKDIVEGNPYIDKVIVFDKDKSRGLFSTINFAKRLKKDGFDIAVILHPTVRVHLLAFLAGIKERIGYDRKGPYFLTRTIAHRKQEGTKHESEYNFDLLEPLGIYNVQRELYMPIRSSSQRVVEELLEQAGITPQETLVAINPASSCISRRWPLSKFAQVIDGLAARQGVKVLIIADTQHRNISEELLSLTQSMPLDFSGRFDLSGLASLFKRCRLVISNDSGPVHMAVAVKTPVISIFGRNQPGLSPRRWGPLGPADIFLHKKTECEPCLAHACTNSFKCLEAISVEEVLAHAERILKVF